jgi:hypothetical protein
MDIGITQVEYWKTAHLSRGMYLVLVVLGGLLGLDHLYLRSPVTAFFKVLSIPLLLGFWYFYDIAQAFGEKEHIEKYGLGIPFYGPIGLGAGMFADAKPSDEATKPSDEAAKASSDLSWKATKFMLYIILTSLIGLPLNKLIIGDYWAFFVQLLMFMPGIFLLGIPPLIAICWGISDLIAANVYPRSIFESGTTRFLSGLGFLDACFPGADLGPGKFVPPPPAPGDKDKTIFGSIFAGLMFPFTMAYKTLKPVVEPVVTTVADTAGGVYNKVAPLVEEKLENKADAAVDKIADTIIDRGVGAVNMGLKAGTLVGTGGLGPAAAAAADVAALPGALVNSLKAPAAAPAAAAPAAAAPVAASPAAAAPAMQKGGAVIQSGGSILPIKMDGPAVSSTVVIFSVLLLAFSGYVLYMVRKTIDETRDERTDDSPPESDSVRKPAKTSAR